MLQPNELRSRAAAFAASHADDRDERADTQTFWNDFFAIFGIERKRVGAYFEAAVTKLSGARGRIDLLYPKWLVIEQKSLGKDLFGARAQALDYILALPEHEKPRFRLVCDFRTWHLTDFESGDDPVAFTLADLPRHIHRFNFLQGSVPTRFRDQDPVNIKAAELVGLLHDALEASRYTGHKLEVFLTRIVFCLFADDTGIFAPKDKLLHWLEDITDPTAMGRALNDLFEVLNTDEPDRQTTLSRDMAGFPYINGHLFAERIPAPAFDDAMRTALLNACRFDWGPISPAIFGSLFQSVMNPAERRRLGAHYTTEKNILKLIGPLFMDDLRADFARLRARKDNARRRELARFQQRLAGLTFFDPACGCGNFLIIAYRELRQLEMEVVRELQDYRQAEGTVDWDVKSISLVDVNQFHGIEIEEFPARIAETAMWMMDHVMNARLSEAFGQPYQRIPLRATPRIAHADALETDWATVLPPERCSYVLGNPPFIGAKMQTETQRAQVRRIANLGKSGGTLDFVAAWFLKAGEYIGRVGFQPTVAPPRIAFVATNSITQGEQVAQLWPLLFDRYGLEIAFAHRTFEWDSEARGKAHVHAVILGLDMRGAAREVKRLFSYDSVKADPTETAHRWLSPYLFDASNLGNPHLVVKEEPRPVNGLPRIVIGSKPIDGGHYIFSADEMRAFLATEPGAEPYFRPFIGSREFLHGEERFILYLGDARPQDLTPLRRVREVIANVRRYRLGEIAAKGKDEPREPGQSALDLAARPTEFHVTVVPDAPFLVLPEVSSEKRDYAPIAWKDPPTVPSSLVRVMVSATLPDFALLTSAIHMAWLRNIGGRLKSDYRYSIGLVYNTFPLPMTADDPPLLRNLTKAETTKLTKLGKDILDARAAHPGATLATLYDPDLMPPNLRKAHQTLDRAVDRLYRPAGFASDRERVEHLFALYERQTAPLLATKKKRR